MDLLTRMRAFVDVVNAQGFSAAARKVGRSKALLSKHVRELEDQLGVLLLNRTTRQFSLTEAGNNYYHRAVEIIRELDDLQDSITDSHGNIRGRIKLSAPRTYADSAIGQSLIDFCLDHEDIKLDIHLDDRFVDLVEEGFDVAIRITSLQDSSLIARRLAPFNSVICAAPSFLEKHGTPKAPQELVNYPCIIDTNNRMYNNWVLPDQKGIHHNVVVKGPMEVNSPLAARNAAICGLGIAKIPLFVAQNAITDGKLQIVLDNYVDDAGGIYAVYPHRRHLPAKVRMLMDYLVQWFKNNPASGNNIF